jgi:stearoyl-CoA desaturase (delta-9 desaturase)
MSESTILPVADPDAELPPRPEPPERLSWGVWITNFLAVVVPLLGLCSIAIFLWGWGFSWTDLGLLLGMYLFTAIGITVGFHRLFVHRSFETYGFVKFILGVLGSMAVEGPVLKWVAQHRRHHQHSDRAGDPHSPHLHGRGFRSVLRGLWHAHIGWVFQADPPDLDRYIKDLLQSRLVRVVSALTPLWIALSVLLPGLLGGIITQTWGGVWTGLIWGGLVRIFVVHHITWSVNSVCHLWGFRPYRSEDESRDNPVFGVLALGEGYHNTHHAFPTSARHGLRWWQIDISYYVIRVLAWLHLAWDVKLPSKEAQAKGRRIG